MLRLGNTKLTIVCIPPEGLLTTFGIAGAVCYGSEIYEGFGFFELVLCS